MGIFLKFLFCSIDLFAHQSVFHSMVYRPMGVPENISEGLCSQNYFHNIILHDNTKIPFAIYTDGVKAIVSKIACTLV